MTTADKPHPFVPGAFARGERGGQWPEETCNVCGRDPRNSIHSSPTTDDKPSIAELQRQVVSYANSEQDALDSRDSMIRAMPALLEIAAAALAWSESDGDDVLIERVLLAAVSKVRP